MRKPALAVAAVLLAGVVTAPAAAANPPGNQHCFGVVSSQRAVAHHDIGQHASEQDVPRLGLGNVARLILGEIDGDPATSCS